MALQVSFVGVRALAIAIGWLGAVCGLVRSTTPTLEPTEPPRVVLVVDCSGSMRDRAKQAFALIEDLVTTLPVGSSLSLNRFDEQAVEFARTESLTPTQRETILRRLQSQEMTGRFTDFKPALEQIQRSAAVSSGPLLIVVVTDLLSDPPPNVAFQDLPQGLEQALADRDFVRTVLLVPDGAPEPQLGSDSKIEVLRLGETSAAEVLARMPRRPPPPVLPYLPPPVVDPEPPRKPSWFLSAWICVIAAICGIAAAVSRDAQRARALRDRRTEKVKRALPMDLVVWCKGVRFNLGCTDDLTEVRLGGNSRCDVQVFPPEQQDGVLILRRRGECFFLNNQTQWPVHVKHTKIEPQREARISLPARVGFPSGGFLMSLFPRQSAAAVTSVVHQTPTMEVTKT